MYDTFHDLILYADTCVCKIRSSVRSIPKIYIVSTRTGHDQPSVFQIQLVPVAGRFVDLDGIRQILVVLAGKGLIISRNHFYYLQLTKLHPDYGRLSRLLGYSKAKT